MPNESVSGSSPLSVSGVPSSLDDEFFEESRPQKLWRKLRQEPLIPIGCIATCYALYMATKSIRQGDKTQTNRMFRARVYAQGFTLLALVAGSIFYKDERMRRKKFEEVLEDKKAAEKREKWLRELEARDREEQEWRARVEKEALQGPSSVSATAAAAAAAAKAGATQVTQAAVEAEDKAKKSGWAFWSKSVKEEVTRDGWGPGMWAARTRDAWRRF